MPHRQNFLTGNYTGLLEKLASRIVRIFLSFAFIFLQENVTLTILRKGESNGQKDFH